MKEILNIKYISFGLTALLILFVNFAFAQNPQSIPNMELWLSADTGLTITANKISQWNDLSGNGKHAYQNNSSEQPTYDSLIPSLQNKPGVYFNGNNNLLIDSSIHVASVYAIFNWDGNPAIFPDYGGIATQQIFSPGTCVIASQSGSTQFYTDVNDNVFNGSDIFINRINVNQFAPLSDYKIYGASKNTANALTNLVIGRFFNQSTRTWIGNIVELIIYDRKLTPTEEDIVYAYFKNKYTPTLSLPSVLNIPYGFCDTTISVSSGFTQYNWSNGSIADSMTTNISDEYTIETTDLFGFISKDTIQINFPGYNLPSFTNPICAGDTLTWNTQLSNNGYNFSWNNSTSDSLINITQAGTYFVTINDTNNCQLISNSIIVTRDDYPYTATLGLDTNLCSGNTISLITDATQTTAYLWGDNSTNSTLLINSSGNFTLMATNTNGCIAFDTIHVNIIGIAPIADFSINTKCEGDLTSFFDASDSTSSAINSWNWNFGDLENDTVQNPNHAYLNSGVYNINLIVSGIDGCSGSTSKSITIYKQPIADFTTNNACIGDLSHFYNSSLLFGNADSLYTWSFDDLSANVITNFYSDTSHLYNAIGDYNAKLKIVTANGCVDSVIKIVKIKSSINCLSPNDISNIELWLSADNGITLSANKVIQWNDLSGNNKTAYQNNVSEQPSFVPTIASIMDKPGVHFDGTNNLLIDSAINIASVYAIFDWEGVSGNFPDYNGLLTQQLFTPGTSVIAAQSNTIKFYADANDCVFNDTTILINRTDTNKFLPLNNYKMFAASKNTPNALNNLIIGRFFNQTTRTWVGNLVELVIYDRKLTAAEEAIVYTYFRNKYMPVLDLPATLNIPYGFCDTSVVVSDKFITYNWSNNTHTNQLTTNRSDEYTINTTDLFGFNSTDSIQINFPSYTKPNSPSIICDGNSLYWNTQLSKSTYNFIWSNGTNDSLVNITQVGNYFVTITDTNNCQLISDIVVVNVDMYPTTTTIGGKDTALCKGNTIGLLNNQNQTVSYTWSTFETTSTIAIIDSGSYSLVATNTNNCIAKDTIFVHIAGQAPTANFTITAKCEDDFTAFIDSSISSGNALNSWHWNFGDSSNDTIQNPNHIYTNPGNYNVSLLVSGVDGCKATTTQLVTIYKQPIANFYNYWSCNNDSTKFFNASNLFGNTLQSTHWNFNDPISGASNVSANLNPKHLYNSTGNHTIQLIVTTQNGCVDSVTKNIDTKIAPIANFTTSPSCENVTTQFNDISTIQTPYTTYKRTWDFGDGLIVGPQANGNFPHLYSNTSSSYNASLTIVSSSGCKDSISKTINVGKIPIANFSYNNNCPNTLTNLLNTSTVLNDVIASSKWNVDNVIYNTDNVSTALTTGTHNITLTVNSSQHCTDDYNETITVQPLPNAVFTLDANYGNPPFEVVTNNNSTNASVYNWYFGNGETSSLFEPTTTFNDSGKFEIKLVASNSDNCSDTLIKYIDVIPSKLDIAITSIKVSNKNSFSEITIDLANLGTEIANTMDLIISADNQNQAKELWTGTILPGYIKTYTLTSSVRLSENSEYICVTAENINSKQDQKPENNTNCNVLISSFTLPSPMPNPAFNTIAIPIILPDKGTVIFTAYDSKGALLTSSNMQLAKGINFVDFDITKWNADVYFYTVKYNDETLKNSFIKIQQ